MSPQFFHRVVMDNELSTLIETLKIQFWENAFRYYFYYENEFNTHLYYLY